MKAFNLAACCVVLGLVVGCAAVDGVNTYHLRGQLVNAQDGKPVVGARIVGSVFLDHDPPAECWRREFSITDGQGRFDAPVGRLWGGVYPLFLMPELRVPEVLDRVAVYIGVEGKWQKRVVAVGEPQQTKATKTDRWIELGNLSYDPSSPTVTTRPAGGQP